jgi:hypothetical protein
MIKEIPENTSQPLPSNSEFVYLSTIYYSDLKIPGLA